MLKLRCDVCGNVIEKPEQGWVEWIDRMVNGERRAKGLRLVHSHGFGLKKTEGCRYLQSSLGADESIGDDGLVEFLAEVGIDRFVDKLISQHFPIGDVREMMKRLFVPGFDEMLWNTKAHSGRAGWIDSVPLTPVQRRKIERNQKKEDDRIASEKADAEFLKVMEKFVNGAGDE